MRRLIINADDFGMTDGISRGIVEMLEEGSITSTTMMMAIDGCRERCKKYDIGRFKGRVGVHLHLNQGKPLAGAANVPSLVDEAGDFRSRVGLASFDPKEAKVECRLQIEAAREALGYMPSHVDSHYTFHFKIPHLAPSIVELVQEYDLPLRRVKETFDVTNVRLPGTYLSVSDWTGMNLDEVSLQQKILKAFEGMPEEGVLEVVCHPGYCDEDLMEISSYNKVRENDMAMLRKIYQSGWYADNGVELISFSEIGKVD